MVNKGCEVSYCFSKGFILNEEHLQTISSMIRERYTEELVYKITKSDSYIYQTSDINEIFKEENSNANLINKLVVAIDNSDIINFQLCFEKGKPSTLKIVGEDKDKIFLLYNEIKTYVEKEITIIKTFLAYDTLQSICSILSTFLMLGCFVFMQLMLKNSLSVGTAESEKAINSSDILVKLNYLIVQLGNTDEKSVEYLHIFWPVMFGSIVLIFLPKIVEFLWGKKGVLRLDDYFLIGKQKNVYDKKMKMRNNLIWTIGIGLVVSIVGGLLVYFFTK